LAECELRRVKRSGPGGQRRNKVETGVVLRHRPTGIEAEASERRSQFENQRVALTRLQLNLALQVRTPVVPGAAPSALWQSRCRNGRIAVSERHEDFAAILAEALDRVVSQEYDVKAAAEGLGCTMSQLVKLLKTEPRALAAVNARRGKLGLGVLK
jgi:hypothetical protein